MILQNPAPAGWLSQPYGGATAHKGIDYGYYNADLQGSQTIRAAAPGRVESVTSNGGYNQGWGNRVVIDHGYGIKTTYNHMATGSATVRAGQQVAAGQILGRMGATGKTVPVGAVHLHFELLINGTRVDPAPYFTKNLPGIPVVASGGKGDTPPPAEPLPILKEHEMIRIQSPGRGIALIGPGYFRTLTSDEEVVQSEPLITKHISGNDRQFDLWRSMASGGESADALATRKDAQNAANIASEVRNLIVDPKVGVLQAIGKVTVDPAAIQRALTESMKGLSVNAALTDKDLQRVAQATVDLLAKRASD